ncbi:MAG: hypothetical protein K0V04_30745 [Deltaproteobacteria bacterium]|nr:hypothetical protein [Deltaproteobacteria bacterium]
MKHNDTNPKLDSTPKHLSIEDLKNVRGAMFEDAAKTKSETTEDACCKKSWTETVC